MYAVRSPTAVGEKETVKVHEPLGIKLLPQLFDWIKSVGSAPDREIPEIVRFAFPVLLKVTVCAIEVEPTARTGKDRPEDERETTGTPPIPVSGTSTQFLGLARSVIRRVELMQQEFVVGDIVRLTMQGELAQVDPCVMV
jgi:hypothetical protein